MWKYLNNEKCENTIKKYKMSENVKCVKHVKNDNSFRKATFAYLIIYFHLLSFVHKCQMWIMWKNVNNVKNVNFFLKFSIFLKVYSLFHLFSTFMQLCFICFTFYIFYGLLLCRSFSPLLNNCLSRLNNKT